MAEQTRIMLTAEEFEALPESQNPTELIEGELVVRGTPKIIHQIMVRQVFKLVDSVVDNGQVLFSPVSVKLNNRNYYQPDVLWVSATNPNCVIGEGGLDGAPDLVVEVISPGTAQMDRGVKFDVYQQAGVREYWIIEPDEAFLEVWQWVDGVYHKIGLFTADSTFSSPVLGKTISLETIFAE